MIIMMVCGATAYGRKILRNYVIQVFCHHHHIEDDGLVGNDCDDKVDGNIYLLNFCHVTPNFAMLKYALYIYLIRYHIISNMPNVC